MLSPRPPADRRPGSAMRSAAVLALLLCAGQGERARSLRGQGPGLPCPPRPALRSRYRAAPRAPPDLPCGAARRGAFSAPRTAPPPPSWPREVSSAQTPQAGPFGHNSRRREAGSRCLHLMSGLGVWAASRPAPAPDRGWPRSLLALPLASIPFPSSRCPCLPVLDFCFSVSPLTILLPQLFSLSSGIATLSLHSPPTPIPFSPWPGFHTCLQPPQPHQSRHFPKGES